MKKVITLFVYLFYCCLIGLSQNVTIKGHIIASSDGLPVKDVNISVKGKTIGTSSDEKGNFILKNVSLPCDLKISHIAYLSKEVSLTKKDISKRNTINLNISLADKTTPISEIVIRTKPYYRLERLVYDFEIDDNYVYTITNKNDKKHLSVYTFEDYRKRTQEIPKECNEVSFDCHNKLRVKKEGRDDYWRITSSDTSLKYTPYDSILNGIQYIIANPNNYEENKFDMFFRWYFDGNKSETIPAILSDVGVNYSGSLTNGVYFSYDKAWWSKVKQLFRIYEEGGKLKYKMVYYAFYDIDDWLFSTIKPPFHKYKFNPKINNLELDNFSIDRMNLIRRSNDILEEYLTRLIPPPSSGILNIHVLYYSLKLNIPVSFITTNKHLYIFNFDKGVLYKLDEDNTLLSTIKIDEVFKNDFNYSDIIFNKELDKCFVRYDNSYTILKELDLNTGKYIRTIKLPQNKIEKIRIVKNYIYYTVALEGENALERQLFKLKINDELTQN
ncbi:MAG: rane protein [Bacteroidetes bacterium]|nr:rane protein [Bacteroidota bacterium]